MEDVEWNDLEHAYGNASDIPELLSKLEQYPVCENYQDEPFYTLWGSLCHQGTVYSASYPAVIKIIELIESSSRELHYNYYLLPLCIEISRLQGNGPKLNANIEKIYHD